MKGSQIVMSREPRAAVDGSLSTDNTCELRLSLIPTFCLFVSSESVKHILLFFSLIDLLNMILELIYTRTLDEIFFHETFFFTVALAMLF